MLMVIVLRSIFNINVLLVVYVGLSCDSFWELLWLIRREVPNGKRSPGTLHILSYRFSLILMFIHRFAIACLSDNNEEVHTNILTLNIYACPLVVLDQPIFQRAEKRIFPS